MKSSNNKGRVFTFAACSLYGEIEDLLLTPNEYPTCSGSNGKTVSLLASVSVKSVCYGDAIPEQVKERL
jgi:hypothetical protein